MPRLDDAGGRAGRSGTPTLRIVRLEVRHLELLLAVERAGSISGAARLLGTDQPHVTRQLRRIEDQLGHIVFERTGTGTRPTVPGSEVLEQARTALRAFTELADTAQGVSVNSLRVLHYALDMTPIIAYLRTRLPGLALTSTAVEPAEGRAELLNGTADLFLVLQVPHMPWPDPAPLVEVELVTDPTVVYLPADHPLAGKEEIDLHDLANDDWITGNDADSIRMVRDECRLLGGFEPRISYRTTDNATIRNLLEMGMGVVLGARSSPRRPGFVARRYRGATPAHWVLLHRRGVLPSSALSGISDAIRDDHRARLRRADEDDERHRVAQLG